MTIFGHAVLFNGVENSEDTASPKTPMQWHTTLALSCGKVPVITTRNVCGSKDLDATADRSM